MPPLPMRPLVDNCTTTADGLSRGNFPFPAAADVTPRPLPRMGKGGGMG